MRLYDETPVDGGGSAAGESLAQAAAKDNTVTVPQDMLPNCKPGDIYKVVSADENGVVLEHTDGMSEEEDWNLGAKKAAAEPELT